MPSGFLSDQDGISTASHAQPPSANPDPHALSGVEFVVLETSDDPGQKRISTCTGRDRCSSSHFLAKVAAFFSKMGTRSGLVSAR